MQMHSKDDPRHRQASLIGLLHYNVRKCKQPLISVGGVTLILELRSHDWLNIRRYEITTPTHNSREMYHLKAFRLYANYNERGRSNVRIMVEFPYELTNCIPPPGRHFSLIKATRPNEWVTPLGKHPLWAGLA